MIDKFLNKVHNADCLDFMKELPDKSVDLVITSPPYNVGKNNMTQRKYQSGDDMGQDEYYEWTKDVLDLLIKKSHTIFYNIQMLSDNKRTVLALLGDYRNQIRDIIIWNKAQAAPAIEPGVMTSKFEFVIIFSDDCPEKRKFQKGNFHGNFANVIEGKNAANENEYSEVHKATFPIYLPTRIIERFSAPEDIIFDPFMGLGTTAVAAIGLKRQFIGCELSEEYCKIAEERIKVAQSKQSLF